MDLAGQTLGKYKLIRRLGKGGMAQVYQANQPTIDRMVAVKVLHSHLAESDDFVTRFKREARSLGQLQHPNIVRVIDFDAAGEMYYMVMDYIAGKTLRDYLDESGVLSSSEALTLTGQLADALSYAHENGTIHRDIKPSNIMFTDEACTQAVLADFGITRLMDDATITMSGAIVGTPAYMSPEAVMGEKVDGRSDIYSLGVILYEMVTGRAPYQGNTPLSLVVKQIHEPLPSPLEHNPNLPLPVVELLEKSLAKSAADRYQTADDMLSAIQAAQLSLGSKPHGSTIAATTRPAATAVHPPAPDPETAIKPLPAISTSNRLPWIIAGVLVAVALFAGIRLVTRNQPAAEERAVTLPETTVPATATSPPEPTATDSPAVVADLTEPAPAPTEAPAAAPAPTAVPIPVDVPGRFGSIRYADTGTTPMGAFTLQLDRVAQPPAGFHYELWLEAADGSLRNMGPPVVENSRLRAAAEPDENLFATTRRALISIEPDASSGDEISGEIAFVAELPDAFADELHRLLVNGVNEIGFLAGAQGQTAVAAQHSQFSLEELAQNNLNEAKVHIEHVVNILDGETGDRFGDINLDGQAQNPGDGFGVQVYLTESRLHLEQALQTEAVTAVRLGYGEEAIAAIDNSLSTVDAIFDNALTMVSTDTPEEALPFAEAVRTGLNELLGTGGQPTLPTAYAQTLLLAELPFVATQDGLPAPAPLTGTDAAGILQLSSSASTQSGAFRLQLDQIDPPPAGFQYTAWLQNSEPDNLLLLGVLAVRSEWGNLNGSPEINLFTGFDRLLISLEPEGHVADQIAGEIVFSGDFQLDVTPFVQQLLDAENGILAAAEAQIGVAMQHRQFAQESLAAGDLTAARIHMEHVINILDGEDGEVFGDVNQDGQAQNPGDGVGVRGYWQQVIEIVGEVGETAVLTNNQPFYTDLLAATAENNITATLNALDQASKVFASDTPAEAQPFIENVSRLLETLITGTDLDGSGVIDPLLGEGGVAAAINLTLAIHEIPINPISND